MSLRSALRAFVIVGGAFAGGLLAGAGVVREAVAGVWSDYAGLDTLARAITTIERRYVAPVEPERLAHAAVQGMTDILDDHSTYHPPSQWRALSDDKEAVGTGIGIAMERHPSGVRVARVVPEAPADLAGIEVGMVVQAIDGSPVSSVDDANRRILGALGQPVVLSGQTPRGDAFELAVVRDTFEDIRVGGGPLPHQLYYIRVGRFTRGAVLRFNQQLGRMPDTTRGLVLDLRGNPGGLLSEAGAIADRFLTEGTIVDTVARDGRIDGKVDATDQGDELSLPVAILVDGHSASAAEVLAGALQARRRATLVGSSTYGKGSVQSIVEFEDGGALRLTTAKYRLPDQRFIDTDHPLAPDLVVDDPRSTPARTRLADAIRAHVPDADQQAALLADLDELRDAPVDPQAPAPIALGADPAAHVGLDPVLDAAIAHLTRGGNE